MAAIPANIKRDPRFVYLTDYMSPEEAAKVVASGIAINQVGVVPSMQVPPGNRGCEGLGTMLATLGAVCAKDARACPDGSYVVRTGADCSFPPCPQSLLDVAGDIQAPTFDWWGNMTTAGPTMQPSSSSPGAVYPGGGPAAPPKQDKALSWVEDNWLVLAGGLGALLAVSMLSRR